MYPRKTVVLLWKFSRTFTYTLYFLVLEYSHTFPMFVNICLIFSTDIGHFVIEPVLCCVDIFLFTLILIKCSKLESKLHQIFGHLLMKTNRNKPLGIVSQLFIYYKVMCFG